MESHNTVKETTRILKEMPRKINFPEVYFQAFSKILEKGDY